MLPEFVMYWVDSNEVHTSWNSKFLQHVKDNAALQDMEIRMADKQDAATLAQDIARRTEVSATTSPTPAGPTEAPETPTRS